MIESVFAQVKYNRKLDRFLRRGRSAVRSQWRAATHNLLNHHMATGIADSPLGHFMATLGADPAAGLSGVGPATNTQDWFIQKFYCRNLSGQADTAVLFDCCTSDSPTPLAIFRAVSGRWKLSYTSTVVIYGLFVVGHSIIEHRPLYAGNPLCCPNYFHHWSVTWNGHRWKLRFLAGNYST